MICKQALNRKLNCGVVLYLVVLTTRKKQVIKKKITKNTCIHCTNKHYTTYKNPNGSCHMDPPNNKHVMFPSTSKTESFPVKKKTTKGWIETGHSQLHLQNKFEWYLPCENQFYLHEKKQCLPNQDFELTLILKNKGQLCQDDDCKESWEGPSAFPWRNSFSTISSPKKWNGWEQVYVLRPGWAR